MSAIRIAIADDHQIFRKGLLASLQSCTKVQTILEASNGRELIEAIPGHLPEVILMDLQMPVMDGIEATRFIKTNFEHIKVLALSMHDDEKYVMRMMEAGACGYLLKSTDPDEIIDAIITVQQKQFYFNEHLSITLLRKLVAGSTSGDSNGCEATLNTREIEVLKLICHEHTNAEIADKLFLSKRTVEGYRTRLFEKTKARNIVGLVMFALKQDLIKI